MIRFYLVRHGETEGNKEGYFRGRYDYPLNANGINQAKETAFYFKNKVVDLIYSSPLKRAYQTALEIAKLKKLEIKEDEGFNNLYFASWEGKPKSFIKDKFPQLWRKWIKEPEDLRVDDSETIDEVGQRAKKRLLEIIKYDLTNNNEIKKKRDIYNFKKDQKKIDSPDLENNYYIVITTHRVVIKALLAKILNIPKPYFWKIHTDNASISILDYYQESGFMLYKLNNTSHLSHFLTEIY